MSDGGKKLGAFVCRGVLGTSLVAHGLSKLGLLGGGGIKRYADYLEGIGIDGATAAAWGLALGQLVAGVVLLVGCFHRVAATFAILVMATMIWLVHGARYFLPYGLEYQLALIALAVSVYANGPGPFAYKVEFKKNK